MDIIERIAKALEAAETKTVIESGGTLGGLSDFITDEDYLILARAAIEAMREPTDEMCAAMARYYDDNYRKGHEREDTPAESIWQDMIDAALKKA